ncbi:ParB family protein [Frigoribacterium sp. Leaf263]|uniref:ParB family protein n=1 Tax=Frigoribacterium sp. Leaf263 TaxID=1736313 RepID=UPI003FA4BEB1
MTDNEKSRRIGGLEPRAAAPDLSRLIRRNRPEASGGEMKEPAAADDVSGDTTEGHIPSTVPGAKKPMLGVAREPSSSPAAEETAVDSETKRMTVYIASRHYARARAAYRATSYAARDRSWSDFVEKAIVAELERREAQHNAGKAYAPDSSPLSPGRPLSS